MPRISHGRCAARATVAARICNADSTCSEKTTLQLYFIIFVFDNNRMKIKDNILLAYTLL